MVLCTIWERRPRAFLWVPILGRNHLPCKHFFAIFRHYPEWGWKKLPQHYTNSSMLTLDEGIIGKPAYNPTPPPCNQVVDDTLDSSIPSQNIQMESGSAPTCSSSYAHLPQKRCSPKDLGSICREILGEIRQLTFLMDNRDDLENLKAELREIQQRFQKVAPSDGGLQVEGGEPQPKKRKLQNQECPRRKLPQIPKQQLCKKTQIQWTPWCQDTNNKEDLSGTCRCPNSKSPSTARKWTACPSTASR